jgi:hypothetical protein
MSDMRDAIHAVVSARLSTRSAHSGSEDVEAMAQEATMLATHIEEFRWRLSPQDTPEPLWLHLREPGGTLK